MKLATTLHACILLLLSGLASADLNICSSSDEDSSGHTFARMEKDCRDYLMVDGSFDTNIENGAAIYARNGCPYWDDRDSKNMARRCVVMKVSNDGGLAKWFYKEEMNTYKLAATACGLELIEAQAVIVDAPTIFGSIGYNGRPHERHRQASAISGDDGSWLDLPEPIVDTLDEPGYYDFDGNSVPIKSIIHSDEQNGIIGQGALNGSELFIVSDNGFNRKGFHAKHAKVVDQIPSFMSGKSHQETRAQIYHSIAAPYSSIHAPDEDPPRLAPEEVQMTWSEEEREGITRVLQQFRCSLVKAMELGFEKSFQQITKLSDIDDLRVALTSECFWDTIEDFCGNYIPMVSMNMQGDSAKLYFYELVDNFYKPEYALKRIAALQEPLYPDMIEKQRADIQAVLDKHHQGGKKKTLNARETKARDKDLASAIKGVKTKTYLGKYNGIVEDARKTSCEVTDTVQMPDACIREHVLRKAVPPYFGFPYASTQDGKVLSSQVWRGAKEVITFWNQTSHRYYTNVKNHWGDHDGFPGIPIDQPGDIVYAVNQMVDHCQATQQGQICWAFTNLLQDVGGAKLKELKSRCKKIRRRQIEMVPTSACDAILGGVNPGENEKEPNSDLSGCDDLFGSGNWYSFIVGFWQVTSGVIAKITNDPLHGIGIHIVIGEPDPSIARSVEVFKPGTCVGKMKSVTSRTMKFDLTCVFDEGVAVPLNLRAAKNGKISFKAAIFNNGNPVTCERSIKGNMDIHDLSPRAFLMAREVVQELTASPNQQQDGCSKPEHWCRRGKLNRATCECVCDTGYAGDSCEMRDRCGIVHPWVKGSANTITLPSGNTVGPMAKKTLPNALIEAALATYDDKMPSAAFSQMLKRRAQRPLPEDIEELRQSLEHPDEEEARILEIVENGVDHGVASFEELIKKIMENRNSGKEAETLEQMNQAPGMGEADEDDPCWKDVQVALRNEVRRHKANAGMSEHLKSVLVTTVAGKSQKMRPPVDLDGEVTAEDIIALPQQLKMFTAHIATIQCMMWLIQEHVPQDKDKSGVFIGMSQSSVSLGEKLPFNFRTMYPIRVIKPGVGNVTQSSTQGGFGSGLIEERSLTESISLLETKEEGNPFVVPIRPHCDTGDCDYEQSKDVLKMDSIPKAYRNRIRPTENTRWHHERMPHMSVLQQSSQESEGVSSESSTEVTLPWPEEEDEQPLTAQPRTWDCRYMSGEYFTCGDQVQLTAKARATLGDEIARAVYGATITGRNNKKDKWCLTRLGYKFKFNSGEPSELRSKFSGCYAKEDFERYTPSLPRDFKFVPGFHHVCDCPNDVRAGQQVCTLMTKEWLVKQGYDETEMDVQQACVPTKAPKWLAQTKLTPEECEFYVPAAKRTTRSRWGGDAPSCDSYFNGWEWHFGNPRDTPQRGFFLNRCTGVTMWPASYKGEANEPPPPWVDERFRGSMYLDWEPVTETPSLPRYNEWLKTLSAEADVGWQSKMSCEAMRAMQWAFHRSPVKETDSEGRPGSEMPPGLVEKVAANYACPHGAACAQEFQNVLMVYRRNVKEDAEAEYFGGFLARSAMSSGKTTQAALASFAGSSLSDGKQIVGMDAGSGSYSKASKYGFSLMSNFLHSVLWDSLSQGLLFLLSKGGEYSGKFLSLLGRGASAFGASVHKHVWLPWILPGLQGLWSIICGIAQSFYTVFIWAPSIYAPSKVSEFSVWSAGKSKEKSKELSEWIKKTQSYAAFCARMKALGEWFGQLSQKSEDNLLSREGTSSKAFLDNVLAPIGKVCYTVFHWIIVTSISEFICGTIIWGGLQGSGSVLSKLGEWAGSASYWTVWGIGKAISTVGGWIGSAISATGRGIKYVFYDLFSYAFIWKFLNSEGAWNSAVRKSAEWKKEISDACGALSTACGLWSTESKASLAAKIKNACEVSRDKSNTWKAALAPHLQASKEKSISAATNVGKSLWHGSASTWNSIAPYVSLGSHYFFGTIAFLCTAFFDVVINLSVRNIAWSISSIGKSISKVSVMVSTISKKTGPEIDTMPGAHNMWWKTVEKFWPSSSGAYEGVKMPLPQWD